MWPRTDALKQRDRYHVGLAAELSREDLSVNCLEPVAIVLTQDSEAFVGDIARHHPEQVESVETMAEAAMALARGQHTGQVALSPDLLHTLQRPARPLDGTSSVTP